MKHIVLAMFGLLSIKGLAQDRLPDCDELIVTRVAYTDNYTLEVDVFNDCQSCIQHFYTGVLIYDEYDELIAWTEYMDDEASPPNKYFRTYKLYTNVSFDLRTIYRIEMVDICHGMYIDVALTSTSAEQLSTYTLTSNPVYNLIQFEEQLSINKAKLITPAGDKEYALQLTNGAIDVSSIPSGIYLLLAENERGKVYRQKILKQ